MPPTDKLTPVPNQPKTPQATFRIPDDLKQAAKVKALENGESLTAVVVRALEAYVADNTKRPTR